MEDKTNINTLFQKADFFYYGIKESKDVEKAFEIFEEIIAIGKSKWGEDVYPETFTDFVFYKYNDGAEENRDYNLAAKLYELAAEDGSINALNNIGTLFLNGFGVSQDFNKAEEYWMAASNKGNHKSQMNLVNLYKSNQYEMLNYSKAIFYCNLAIKNGDKNAIKLLPVLERRSNNISINGKNKNFWSKLKNKMKS